MAGPSTCEFPEEATTALASVPLRSGIDAGDREATIAAGAAVVVDANIKLCIAESVRTGTAVNDTEEEELDNICVPLELGNTTTEVDWVVVRDPEAVAPLESP